MYECTTLKYFFFDCWLILDSKKLPDIKMVRCFSNNLDFALLGSKKRDTVFLNSDRAAEIRVQQATGIKALCINAKHLSHLDCFIDLTVGHL